MKDTWELVEGTHLERTFRFADFKSALAFVDKVGEVAEAHDHHPDVELVWGRVTLKLRSHDAGKVTPRDHALAAAIDRIPPPWRV